MEAVFSNLRLKHKLFPWMKFNLRHELWIFLGMLFKYFNSTLKILFCATSMNHYLFLFSVTKSRLNALAFGE
jgi:hypothetical protein